MSQAASQAAAFYREVAETGCVWTLWGAEGFPVYRNPAGEDVIPFWSSASRAQSMQKAVPQYAAYQARDMPWGFFAQEFAPRLAADGVRIGLNWSGAKAVGYDREPEGVIESVEAAMADREASS